MSKKLFLSAGHGGEDPGAIGNGYKEADLTIELRTLIDKELENFDVCPVMDSNTNRLVKTIAYFKNLVSTDSIVVDLHWNAATPQATGVEVLVPTNPTSIELALASKLAETIAETLDLKLRGNFKGFKGVKSEGEGHHGKLGFFTLKGHNVIVEVCFISNKTDMEKYQKNKSMLAYKIAKILAEFTKK